MSTVHFVSLGCPKNRVDTEVLAGLLQRRGYAVVAEPENADLLVVNTCAFIQAAQEESIEAILEAAAVKARRPGVKLVVAGCLPQRHQHELVAELPEVDFFLGVGELDALGAWLDTAEPARSRLAVARQTYPLCADTPRLVTAPGHSAYLKISEGCSRHCSFCTIPLIRGPQVSRRPADIVAEATRLVAAGVRELVLVAQDVTAYGADLGPDVRLAGLLAALDAIPGVGFIRLLYGHPDRLDPDLIEALATLPHVCHYLDVPIQHVDPAILRAMRRSGREAEVQQWAADLRARIPDLVLRTSAIVGFPGESEAAFRRLLDVVRTGLFDHLGVFVYSPEPGTPAAELGPPVPTERAEKRAETLLAAQRKVSRARNRARIGQRLAVLVEGPSEESAWVLQGRTYGQAPEIDGVTYLSESEAEPGELRLGRIVAATDYDLVARLDP